MRISSGIYRGRKLEVPAGIRPTEGRVKEALISIWGGRLSGARVLDLFAGSGAVGFEALSAGAARVVFVEQSGPALKALEHAASKIPGLAAQSSGLARAALAASVTWRSYRLELPQGLNDPRFAREQLFDLVFADPPYAFGAFDELLDTVSSWLVPGGGFALEHSKRSEPSAARAGLQRVDTRSYGESVLSFYSAAGKARQ